MEGWHWLVRFVSVSVSVSRFLGCSQFMLCTPFVVLRISHSLLYRMILNCGVACVLGGPRAGISSCSFLDELVSFGCEGDFAP